MTAPLRRAHLAIWVLLTALIAAVLVAGLTMRRSANPPNPQVRWENVL